MKEVDRLMTVSDVQARYSCSPPTARKLMRQMPHMEISGLKVWQNDLEDWERDRMQYPGSRTQKQRHAKRAGGLIPYRK